MLKLALRNLKNNYAISTITLGLLTSDIGRFINDDSKELSLFNFSYNVFNNVPIHQLYKFGGYLVGEVTAVI